MIRTTKAASTAGFALVLIAFSCQHASAQQAASAYQNPTAASASMTEAPAGRAPELQGASCGTIGPAPPVQGVDRSVVIGVNTGAYTIAKSDSGTTKYSNYPNQVAATASMTEAPAGRAPELQGASCGSIGPQPGQDASVITGVNTAGLVPAPSLLQEVSNGIDEFKGKVAQKTMLFLQSLQHTAKGQLPLIPSGYTVTKTTMPAPNVVF